MLYETITKICKERGISIRALERASGLPNATIRRWDRSPANVWQVKAAADALGVTVDSLLREAEERERRT